MSPNAPRSNIFSLSRPQGTLLLHLLEQKRPTINHKMLIERAGGLDLVSAGAVKADRISRSVMLMEESGPQAVELEWLPNKQAYGYFTADGYVLPDPAGLQSYLLDMDWWLKWLAFELDLTNSVTPFELLAGQAWDLGSIWASRLSKVPVLFARRLKDQANVKELINVMTQRAGRSGGLILSSSPQVCQLAQWPHRFQARSIADFLSHDADKFRLDHDLISGVFSLSATTTTAERISVSPDLHSLSVDGQILHFRGTIQQRIIKLLVDAYPRRERLRMSAVLRKAGSQAPDLAKAFKNNPAWPKLRQYLKTERGLCWFELE